MTGQEMDMHIITYYFNKGDNYKTMELLNEYISKYDDVIKPAIMMCELFVREGILEQAEHILKQIVNEYGIKGRTNYINGNIMYANGDYEAALSNYSIAMKNGYFSLNILTKYSSAQEKRGIRICREEVLEKYREYVDNNLIHKVYGDLYFDCNKLKYAVEEYKKAKESGRAGLFMAALVYLTKEDTDTSYEILQTITKIENKDILYYDSCFIMATLDHVVNKDTRGLELLIEKIHSEISMLVNPLEIIYIYFLLALCYAELKRKEEVLHLLIDFEEITGKDNIITDLFRTWVMEMVNHNERENSVVQNSSLEETISNSEDEKDYMIYLFTNYLKMRGDSIWRL